MVIGLGCAAAMVGVWLGFHPAAPTVLNVRAGDMVVGRACAAAMVTKVEIPAPSGAEAIRKPDIFVKQQSSVGAAEKSWQTHIHRYIFMLYLR